MYSFNNVKFCPLEHSPFTGEVIVHVDSNSIPYESLKMNKTGLYGIKLPLNYGLNHFNTLDWKKKVEEEVNDIRRGQFSDNVLRSYKIAKPKA